MYKQHQDQGRRETQCHAPLGEVRCEIRILNAGKESAPLMADKLHCGRGDQRYVVDRLSGGRGKCRRAENQVFDAQRRGVGNAERAAEESVTASQIIDQVCADAAGTARVARAELEVIHDALLAGYDLGRTDCAAGKQAEIGIQRKAVRSERIGFRCQQVLHRMQRADFGNRDPELVVGQHG